MSEPTRVGAGSPRPVGTALHGRSLNERIVAVRARIAAASRRCGRDPEEITLVAVSKTHSAETVAAAYAAGLRIFGENRVEEAAPKAAAVAELAPGEAVEWHMIGHIQSRKAEEVLPWASVVHSVDSVRLAARLSHSCIATGQGLAILLEVNVSGESSKYGFAPAELPPAVETIAALPGLTLQGLMTMAPLSPGPQAARPVFAGLRRLAEELAVRFPAIDWRHLSMGMTDDFEIAIEEGATMVRIGRAIFGER